MSWLFRVFTPWFLRQLNVKTVVRDSNIYAHPRYIFVCLNQESQIGSFAVSSCFPTHIDPFYLVNARFAYLMPIWGWYLAPRGVIVWQHFQKSRKEALKKCIEKVKGGESLYMSIEGRRTPDGNLQPYKLGAALIAIETKTPLVGIVMNGSFDIMPYGGESASLIVIINIFPLTLLKIGSIWIKKSGTIYYDVLPIIETDKLKKNDAVELTNRLREMALEKMQIKD